MTTITLENCEHLEEGWCLACVLEQTNNLVDARKEANKLQSIVEVQERKLEDLRTRISNENKRLRAKITNLENASLDRTAPQNSSGEHSGNRTERKLDIRSYTLIAILWKDSAMIHGWTDLEDHFDPKPELALSTGILLHESETSYTLATSMTASLQACGCMTIPKSAIIDVLPINDGNWQVLKVQASSSR